MPSRVDDTYDDIEVSGPIVLSSDDLVPKKGKTYFLEDDDFRTDSSGLPVPNFSMQEVAKCFFGHDADWLRWRIRPDKPKSDGTQAFPNGCFVLDGKAMEFKRKPSPNGSTTARFFTLADVERMAHALAQNGIIDGMRLSVIIIQVRACAKLYGVMGD
jgi:hypothetical protein